MNQDEFLNVILEKLKNNIGVDRFRNRMFENLDKWESINYSDIKTIIEEIKYHGSKYSFFPFIYKFLEIDLYQYYIEESEKNWDPKITDAIINNFSLYPNTMNDEDLTMFSRYENLRLILFTIKTRLLSQGAVGVKVGS